MNTDHELAALADLSGILPTFYDLQGNERPTSPDTQKALLTGNGFDVSNAAAIHASLEEYRRTQDDRWFPNEVIIESGVEARQNFGLGAHWRLCLDGSDAEFATGAPGDQIVLPPLPSGIYILTATVGDRTEDVTVLAAPRRLRSIPELTGRDRFWGINLALYGLQSDKNSGLGDFNDLADAARTAAEQSAAFLGINPLHNMGFCDVDAISPYSPSHRGFLNTSYINLNAIPGIEEAAVPQVFQRLRDAKTVQYQDHKAAHNAALKHLFKLFTKSGDANSKAAFEQFKLDNSEQLASFAQFEALSEVHGPDWHQWPSETETPSYSQMAFHMWVQWVATTQLANAQASAKSTGMALGLYLDVAVGSRRDGAEAWCEQAAIAQGVSVGAPPDHLSPEGQNWNLAAFAPRMLVAERYGPLRRIIGQTMRHAGLIRIDHVLGLNRSFWIPDDGSAGGYIRQPFNSLLALIKIEAERHNCAVVGEDLGLVPDGFRETMRDHGFYGYSVLQYEKDDQGAFRKSDDIPEQVLSCFATHDTPTVKGYETGRDIDWWEKLKWITPDAANGMREQRAAEVSAFKADTEFQTSIHGLLAYSPASLVAIQLDDILGEAESQNLPGTIDEHPNWRRKYDATLAALRNNEQLTAVGALMTASGRGNFTKGESNET